ncbi:hypothetical protein NQ315_006421 [Exocentrus adspersus]|uniref:Uncharacterized protein n=1 Tax=Exocentrus adspersus TaxID=1586481 RepID=A0AAV8VZP3_9CUCU|nr:hypothetical protein NQ315_006421 [Exocentrus adspersus]
MITLPPKPPKDYALRDVNDSVLSSPQFTPAGPPRVTQKGIGKFLTPIPYAENETPEHVPHVTLEPVIKEKMTVDARASWVVEPGKDDFFIHEVYRKYTVPKGMDEYDPRFRHKGKANKIETIETIPRGYFTL